MSNEPQTPGIVRDIAKFALVEIIIATVATVAGRLLLPVAREEIQYIVSGSLIITVALLWVLRSRSQGRTKKLLSISPLFILATIYFLGTFAEQRTMYFIIDASDNMQDSFQQIGRVELEALKAQGDDDFGLAVFGGGVSNMSGCDDIVELVPPTNQEVSLPQISQAVNLLINGGIGEPHGEGLLQNAIMYGIKQLSGRKGFQQIVVITSGLDRRCGDPNRGTIQELANQQSVEFELIIIIVGEVNDVDEKILMAYADRYVNVGTVIEIENVIEDVIRTSPLPYGPYSPYSR